LLTQKQKQTNKKNLNETFQSSSQFTGITSREEHGQQHYRDAITAFLTEGELKEDTEGQLIPFYNKYIAKN